MAITIIIIIISPVPAQSGAARASVTIAARSYYTVVRVYVQCRPLCPVGCSERQRETIEVATWVESSRVLQLHTPS